MKIHTTVAALKASLFQAASKDIRYYLNGLLIEATATETRVVATDGYRMSVVRTSAVNEGVTDTASVIVPRDTVAGIKVAKSQLKTPVTIEPDTGGAYRATGVFGVVVFRPLEGVFPAYRRVVPASTDGKKAQLDPAYLVDLRKSAECLGARRIHVQHNGDGAALITCDDPEIDFVGVVMPQRWKDKSGNEHTPPSTSWVHS